MRQAGIPTAAQARRRESLPRRVPGRFLVSLPPGPTQRPIFFCEAECNCSTKRRTVVPHRTQAPPNLRQHAPVRTLRPGRRRFLLGPGKLSLLTVALRGEYLGGRFTHQTKLTPPSPLALEGIEAGDRRLAGRPLSNRPRLRSCQLDKLLLQPAPLGLLRTQLFGRSQVLPAGHRGPRRKIAFNAWVISVPLWPSAVWPDRNRQPRSSSSRLASSRWPLAEAAFFGLRTLSRQAWNIPTSPRSASGRTAISFC